MGHTLSGRVRFGNFELDLKSGELRPIGTTNADNRVVLREQSFQVLVMLIERKGKIVTREEIKKRLWPNDTVVDFDHSINTTIKVLRRALGDSADSPKYIGTLARRGYNLLVATERVETSPGITPDLAGSERAVARLSDLIGRRVSHYRVLEIIGGGGMGMVYRAEDLRLGRRVALKFLPPEVADDPLALRRFEREAQTASALNHPNICTIYEIEEHEGQPFIVMELLEGKSLNHELASSASGTIPMPRLVEIAVQICHGLQAAHDKGIIHRDMKPANIFLTANGPAKILDFGLAKLIELEEDGESAPQGAEDRVSLRQIKEDRARVAQTLTLTGVAMGTAGYMSPEQVRREKLDVTTDLFSFGLVLYEAATGHRAFAGETAEIVHDAILNKTPPSAHSLNHGVPRKFDTVIARAMEKERAHRYPSATEMREALESFNKETQSPKRRPKYWIAASVLCALVVLGISILWRSRNPIQFSRNDTIVLAVSNGTNDPVFDDAVYSSMFYDLQQTPYIHVLETDKFREALRELHIPDNTKRTPEIGRQVCLRTKSKMVIATSLSDAGKGFHIELQATDCQSGKKIASAQGEAPDRTQVIHVVGTAAALLRSKLGEPKSSLEAFNKPLDEAMSASPEAIQFLTDGYKSMLAGDNRGGALNFQRAIGLDPNLAMAYVALAAAETNLDEHPQAIVAARRAYELRERVTLPVRLHIEDRYYEDATGEQEKAYVVLTQWVESFPDDFLGHNNLSDCALLLGRPDQALAEAREAARLFPSPWSYGKVIYASITADRFGDAKASFFEADTRNFDNAALRYSRALLAFLQKDQPEIERQWNWAVGKPGADHMMLDARGWAEAYYGHLHDSLGSSSQAVDLALKYGSLNDATGYNDNLALREAEVGNLTVARHLANKSLGMVPSTDRRPILALALAQAGEVHQAQRLVDQINHDAPSDTLVQNYILPSIRAAMKLQTNDAAAAIEILRPTVKYDLASPIGFGSLYPAYIRGRAYLQLREGRLAAVEFQKLLDHPGMVGRGVTGALSLLQMARAQKLLGERTAALKSYEDFLTLWKTADPDLPVNQQAKVEYAELHKNSQPAN